MKFSEAWLRTLVDPPLDTAKLLDSLTMAGFEVESAAPAASPFSGVVVAKIEAIAPHPNADKLRVCSVDAGGAERLQIVCGAPNAAVGMTAPCALEGGTLPGGMAIKRTIMRGVESRGMLCSAKELGLADDASGLLALPGELAPGTDLRAALALDDTIVELKITPNRGDCLSVLGIAREVAAVTETPLIPPANARVEHTTAATRRVRIEDAVACPRFAGRMIEGIDARAPTPAWMKQRLERSGVRAISAVVDITNYVMLELGQPLHAYDDRLLEGDVVVRFARAGEELLLLNEQILALEPDLLLVCDENKPLGLAGIMGGEYSGISDDTTTVFLEGAFWNPLVIMGKLRRLGFTSDAGYRFERGVDFELQPHAVERATQLMLDICGGRAGPLQDVKGVLPAREPVRVRTARVGRLLGVPFTAETIASTFARLSFAFERDGADFVVTPPSYRSDLALEEDFVEEVARIVGFDAIPAAPTSHISHMLPDREGEQDAAVLRRRLVARDWQEIVTFGFVSSEVERVLAVDPTPVKVLNPIAAHLDVMRTSLLPGLIETLRANLNRKEPRIRIFELGRVFRHDGAGYAQPLRFGGLALGDAAPEQWGKPARGVDVFDVKGDLEALVAPRTLTTVRATHPALHPGRTAEVGIDGNAIGWLGELHPRLVRRFELPRPPIAFELDLDALLSRPVPQGRPVSRLPIVRRDLAVVLDEPVPAQSVVDRLVAARAPFVESVRLFDVWRGPGLPSGRKSLAILVLMRDTERTLTDAEIDATIAALVQIIQQEFGGSLRSQGEKR